MKHPFPLLFLLAGLWLLPKPAAAQGLVCNALIDNFDFGLVTPDGRDTASTLRWQCNRGNIPSNQTLNIRMCLFITEGASQPGVNPRWMRRDEEPRGLIGYDIFADSGRTQIVGPEGSGYLPMSFAVQLTAGNSYQEGMVPIYGRLYPRQNMLPYQHVDRALYVMPVRSSYNLSAPAPDVDECLHGGGDGIGTISAIDLIDVQAHVSNTCAIGAVTDLRFGQAFALDSDHFGRSTITLHCPGGSNWQVGLDNGLHADDGIRHMTGPRNSSIRYELYRDGNHQLRWGNTLNSDTVSGTGDGTLRTLTVYGRVPAQSTPGGGTYSDTITVTLTF